MSFLEEPEKVTIWCNTHQRPHYLCKVRGGILLPCRPVDVTELLDLEYFDTPKNSV